MLLVLLSCTGTEVTLDSARDSAPDTGWVDADGDGYSPNASELADCDDTDPEDHPGATEICDDEDDDCNGVIDDNVTSPYYADGDLDGHGNPAVQALGCGPLDDYVGNDDDCDDDDASVHPDAPEQCNDQDDDCDGRTDEDAADPATWYADSDDDGHGDASTTAEACDAPTGMVAIGDDCDDANAVVYPGADEVCDGLDDDCDAVPADEVDADGDGQLLCAGDCDDADATVWSGGVELCDDGLDNDCDGTADSDCLGCDYVVLTAASSIQDAIDAASNGDVICAGGDTFYETLDFSGKDVALVGVGPDLSILDGGGVDRVVNFTGGESASAVLQGFTIQNGYVYGDDAGGVLIVGASPTLVDLVIANNENTGYPSLRGGGVFVDGGSPSLTNVIVRDNLALAWSEYHYGLGGGVALADSDAILDNVVLEGNMAGWSGSGLWLEDSSAVIYASVIQDNDACQHGGGGLWVTGGAPVFENVRITGNAAVEEYGVTWGGGAWLDDTDASFTNVVIASNDSWGISASYGGGVYVDDGSPTFTNVIVKGNRAETSGGGVYVGSRGPTFRYSDIYGNSPDDTSGFTDPTGTDGNVSVNPDFYGAALHLDAASPLVDAGDPAILDPDGSTSDIGWFGGPGADLLDLDGDGWASWWLPGPYDATSSPGLDCDDEDEAIYPGSGC